MEKPLCNFIFLGTRTKVSFKYKISQSNLYSAIIARIFESVIHGALQPNFRVINDKIKW